MNGILDNLWDKLGQEKEATEDDKLNERTLPSRHRIRNSSLGGLRPSTVKKGSVPFFQIKCTQIGSCTRQWFINVADNEGIQG